MAPGSAIFTLTAVAALTLSTDAVELHRGVWFWNSTSLPGGAGASPYGSGVVVGDATKEDETVSFFTTHGVKRVYGSYQNRPVTEPGVIGAWNAKLDTAGIMSQLLIDFNDVDDPAEVSDMLVKITNRLINFNTLMGADEAKKFDALHVDFEPQGLPVWSGATPAVKRALLDDLADTYAAVRTHLDTAGFTSIPIFADIPFWFDKLPVDGGSIGWADAADRDAWFAGIGASVDGVSVMTFSKDTTPGVETATLYERTGSFPGTARMAIQPKCGTGFLWPTILHFNAVMNDLEAVHAPDHSTDIENYAFWRWSIEETLPSVGDPISVTIALSDVTPWPGTGGGGDDDDDPVLVFDGLPGFLYIVQHTTDPSRGQWADVAQLHTRSSREGEIIRVPVEVRGPQGFWRVERREIRRTAR